jgi:hypothetical protein
MSVSISVSIGELYDKHCILEIKLEKIQNVEKRIWIQKEYDLLNPFILSNPISNELKKKLKRINSELWEMEDLLRKKEMNLEFDHDFIFFARNVYILNDERSLIKQQINIETKSSLREIKSYV